MNNSYISSFDKRGNYQLRKKYLIIFLFVFIVSLVFFELLNRSFLKRENCSDQTLELFEKEKENIEILIVGDSHAMALAPEEFPRKTFNLSEPSASYIHIYYVLKNYIPGMKKLKILLISIDLHSFSSFKTGDLAHPEIFQKFVDYRELSKIKNVLVYMQKYSLFTVLDSSLGRRVFLNKLTEGMLRKLFGVELTKGIIVPGKNKRIRLADQQNAFDSAEYYFRNRKVFDPVLVTYFEKILELCKKNNIKIVTFQTPVSKYFIDYSGPYITEKMLLDKTADNPEYGKHIAANVNCLELFVDRPELSAQDGHHLTERGVLEFREKIIGEIFPDNIRVK